MEKRRKVKALKIRLEDDLHARLKRVADAEKRSMTRQVEVFVEEAIRRLKEETPPPRDS